MDWREELEALRNEAAALSRGRAPASPGRGRQRSGRSLTTRDPRLVDARRPQAPHLLPDIFNSLNGSRSADVSQLSKRTKSASVGSCKC